MTNVLILTAGFGEGHNTAARNVRAALEATGEARTELVDIFAISYGRLNELARRAYITTINHAPRIWEKIYRLFDEEGSVENNLPVLRRMKRKLRGKLDEVKPGVIVSTYPLYSYLLEQIGKEAGRKVPPLVTVVTDSITINSIWYRSPSDAYMVPNEQTADVMRAAGVPAERIHNTGFPVTLKFNTPITRQPPSETAGRRLLYMVNFGKKDAPALVRELLKLSEISLTVTVGRDEDLRAAVEKAAAQAGRSVEILGWTDRMPELMMEHHLVLSKAGGATVQESIAAQLPMIISQVVPGQEEGNARLLLENGCGALAESAPEIVKTVREAFADDARLWRDWTSQIDKLRRPEAATTIARFALDKAHSSR